jgi:Uncharacterized protein conserved in bacteria (DUF2188)
MNAPVRHVRAGQNGGWVVAGEDDQPSSIHETRVQAEMSARAIVREFEDGIVIVHDRAGAIERQETSE